MVVIWLTGLPCSGKTTIGRKLKEYLTNLGKDVELLDGDVLRKTISKDLGFSLEDRRKHNERVISLAKRLSEEKKIVIVALVSPLREVREKAKEIIGKENFVEVYVNCPLAVCIERDTKGLYKRALAGELKDFTGIHQPYEEPLNPDIILYTAVEKEEESLKKVIEHLNKRGVIS